MSFSKCESAFLFEEDVRMKVLMKRFLALLALDSSGGVSSFGGVCLFSIKDSGGWGGSQRGKH